MACERSSAQADDVRDRWRGGRAAACCRARSGMARGIRPVWVEAALAAVAFAALCVVVLSVAPQIAEPDDGAYHHSIVAMTMGIS